MNRFTRQMRLAEVGESGQARIADARPSLLTHGPAADIEREYLSRAGVSAIRDADTATELADLGVKHEAARDVLHGSLAALLTLRDILKP